MLAHASCAQSLSGPCSMLQGILNDLQLLTDDAPPSSPSVNAYFDSLLGAALHCMLLIACVVRQPQHLAAVSHERNCLQGPSHHTPSTLAVCSELQSGNAGEQAPRRVVVSGHSKGAVESQFHHGPSRSMPAHGIFVCRNTAHHSMYSIIC